MVPLIPFCFDGVCRFFLLHGKHWWEYFDAGTLVLTFCLWLLFLLATTPKTLEIPTDTSASDALDVVRQSFGVFIMIGFMLFGFIALARIFEERLPFLKDEIVSEVISFVYTMAVFLCLVILLVVFLKSKEIKVLIR